MKRLVSKSGVVAYLNEEEGTIRFSDSKTIHSANISYDEKGKITKITAKPIDIKEVVEKNEIPNDEKEDKRAAALKELGLPTLNLTGAEFVMLYMETAMNDTLKEEYPIDYLLRPVA